MSASEDAPNLYAIIISLMKPKMRLNSIATNKKAEVLISFCLISFLTLQFDFYSDYL